MAQANPAAALKNIIDTPELWRKIKFTLLCLLIYRIGSFITAPGIDTQAILDEFERQQNDLLGLYNLFTGGSLSRATVFALGIMPYISASIFTQIAAAVVPTIEKMNKDEEGRKRVNQGTRYLTVALAAVQAFGFATYVANPSFGAVANPGIWFQIQTMLFLTTGAVFIMWLGEQITERGLGNGASLLIFFSIVQGFWPSIFSTANYVTTGVLSVPKLVLLSIVMLVVVAGVVTITLGARRILIQIPQRTMARGRMREASKNFIPLRVIAAGVMPIIFAQSVIIIPGAIAQFSDSALAQRISGYFQIGEPWYYVLSAVLIIAFTYFYTSIIFNPIDVAENLKKQGAFIPGVKPGAKTAEYIETVMERITLPGAVFLAGIALMPTFIAGMMNVPFQFGGTSLLIVVGVAIDTISQVQQHLLLRKYDGFMKKGRVRFRGRQQTTGPF